MSDRDETDRGTIQALLARAQRRIPNLIATRDRLKKGDTLSDVELEELQNMIEGADHSRELVERHPEYHELVSRVMSLQAEIAELALANEESPDKKD